MNTANIIAVKHFQKKFPDTNLPGKTVLDIGSMHVNGSVTGRDLWCATYTGTDLDKGPNVDWVVTDENWGLEMWDTIVSLSCLEHTLRPWKTMTNMAKALKPGGHIITVAPFVYHYHRYPVDCWRFTPDSMQVLYTDAGLDLEYSSFIRPSWFDEHNWNYRFWRLFSLIRNRVPQIDCVAWGRKGRFKGTDFHNPKP